MLVLVKLLLLETVKGLQFTVEVFYPLGQQGKEFPVMMKVL